MDINLTNEALQEEVIDSARTIFRDLGKGHNESVYECSLEVELNLRNLVTIRRQVPKFIFYKGFSVGVGYIDLLLNDWFVIEIKTINRVTDKDEAQLKKYLTVNQPGLLLNFNPYSGNLGIYEAIGKGDG